MRYRALAALAVIACPLLPAADPQLTGLVMPGAKVMAGFNLEQIKTTPFGRYVLARLAANEPSLGGFAGEAGFDWRRDLHEVLFASTGQPEPAPTPGLLLVRGSFDAQRIAAAASKNSRAEFHQGVPIFDGGPQGAVLAVLSPRVAVVGRREEVRAAIGRRQAPTPLEPALAERIAGLSAAQHAWMVSLVPPAAAGAGIPVKPFRDLLGGGLLEGVQETTAGVKFGSSVDLTAEALAASGEDAAALAGALRILADIMASASQPLPGAVLLKDLDVSSEERTVRLSLSVPEAELEKLLRWPVYSLPATKAMATELRQ
jgi:hypothetical protein